MVSEHKSVRGGKLNSGDTQVAYMGNGRPIKAPDHRPLEEQTREKFAKGYGLYNPRKRATQVDFRAD